MCWGESHAPTHVNYFVFPLIPILTRDIQVRGLKLLKVAHHWSSRTSMPHA